jgi:hypothetical protein
MLSCREILPRIFSVLLLIALAACSASPTAAPITLKPGNYTALGVNPKSDHPTPSDVADLQAAVQGTAGQPALVEFYGDT